MYKFGFAHSLQGYLEHCSNTALDLGSCPFSHLFFPISHQNLIWSFCPFLHLLQVSSGIFFYPIQDLFHVGFIAQSGIFFAVLPFNWKWKVIIVCYVNGLRHLPIPSFLHRIYSPIWHLFVVISVHNNRCRLLTYFYN